MSGCPQRRAHRAVRAAKRSESFNCTHLGKEGAGLISALFSCGNIDMSGSMEIVKTPIAVVHLWPHLDTLQAKWGKGEDGHSHEEDKRARMLGRTMFRGRSTRMQHLSIHVILFATRRKR